MRALTEELRGCGAGPLVLNLGGGDVDTSTPMGSMGFSIMAALGKMKRVTKRERVVDSIAQRREAGKDLDGRLQPITNSQIRNARRLIDGGESATTVSRDLGMSRATFHRRTRALDLPLSHLSRPNLHRLAPGFIGHSLEGVLRHDRPLDTAATRVDADNSKVSR